LDVREWKNQEDYSDDKMRENEMHKKFWSENLKGRAHLGDLVLHGR